MFDWIFVAGSLPTVVILCSFIACYLRVLHTGITY